MSETTEFVDNFQTDLTQLLGGMAPFQPYESTGLDDALIEEAQLDANARLRHYAEVISNEKISDRLIQSIRARQLYKEFYPSEDPYADSDLINPDPLYLPTYHKLMRYGSTEAQNAPDIEFRSEFKYASPEVIDFCMEKKMTVSDGYAYIRATHAFNETLHKIRHIPYDLVLHDPLKELGIQLAQAQHVANGEGFNDAWISFLTQAIGTEDLIGEDGGVAEDMTFSLWRWTQDLITEYDKTGGFRTPIKPPTTEIYDMPYESDDPDALYFAELRRRAALKNSESPS